MKVWPKNDDMRKLLRHPSSNAPFPAEGHGEWPNDSFTARRVADGDITLDEPKAAPKATATEAPVEEKVTAKK